MRPSLNYLRISTQRILYIFLNFYRKFALTLNFYIFFLFQSQSINVPILDVRIRWINKVVKINSLNTFAS